MDYRTHPSGVMRYYDFEPVFDAIRRDLGDGFVACDVFDRKNGISVRGSKSNSRFFAMSNQVTDQLITSMVRADDIFGKLDHLLIFEKTGGLVVVAELTEAFRFGMKVDAKKCGIGMLLSVVLPDTITSLRQVLAAQ